MEKGSGLEAVLDLGLVAERGSDLAGAEGLEKWCSPDRSTRLCKRTQRR